MPEERSAKASRSMITAAQVGLGLAIVVVWQSLVALKVLDPFFVSRPSDIAARIATWTVATWCRRGAPPRP